MAIPFELPNLGENIEGGDVVSLLVKEGETVEKDQALLEIETDKAMVEVPSPQAGVIRKIHIQEGDAIKVGQLLMDLQSSDADKEAQQAPAPQATPEVPTETSPETPTETPPTSTPTSTDTNVAADATASAAPGTAAPEKVTQETPPTPATKIPAQPIPNVTIPKAVTSSSNANQAVAAGPATRRLARELALDLTQITGSGDRGRITREDVIAAARQQNTMTGQSHEQPHVFETPGESDQDEHGPITRQKLTKIRQTIAQNMLQSTTSIPHVTNFDDADVTELETFRKQVKEDYAKQELKLTTMPLLIKACALALRQNPEVNASIDMQAKQVIYKQYVNIGIAIDTPRGLVVPTLFHADQLGIPAITAELAQCVDKVRSGKFAVEDLRGGTFTISNLGAIGGTYSTPVINPPQVAILLVGRSRLMPIIDQEGTITPRLMMPLSLSYDHRLVDGATAARFLNDVKAYLQSPAKLLLAP